MEVLSYTGEKTALFVDGRNLYGMAKSLELDIDFAKLRKYFSTRGVLVSCSYYTPIELEEDEDSGRKDFNQLKPLMDYLRYNGWRTFEKPLRVYTKDGETIKRGSMLLEMAVDMMAAADVIEHFVLFSGHGDFIPAVTALQNVKFRRVSIVGTTEGTGSKMMSEHLRGQADNFIDLKDIRGHIERLRK